VHIDEIDVILREDEDCEKGYRAFATKDFPFEIDVEEGGSFKPVEEKDTEAGELTKLCAIAIRLP